MSPVKSSVRPMRRGSASRVERVRLAAVEQAFLAGDEAEVGPLAPFLDHLAAQDAYVFHGSKRHGIAELRVERESTDSTEFGRQTAVFATPDPHWAMFFALVNRANARLISNLSVGFGRRSRLRWYRRDVYVEDIAEPLLTEGRLYVLPRETFRPQPRWKGVVDTAHWVSDVPVAPLFSLPVCAADYPPARLIRAIRSPLPPPRPR